MFQWFVGVFVGAQCSYDMFNTMREEHPHFASVLVDFGTGLFDASLPPLWSAFVDFGSRGFQASSRALWSAFIDFGNRLLEP